MHVLFVHQNYPAQFRYLAPRLAKDLGWRCTFATRNMKAPDVEGVERVPYRPRGAAGPANHPCTRAFEVQVGHAHGVYEALKARPDVRPDLVVAHSGFGSSLFLPQLYDAPVINFFEYYFRPAGGSFGFRPEAPLTEEDVLRIGTHGAMTLLDLDNCDRGWCPNYAQRDSLPREYHGKVEVLPEGVDTELWKSEEKTLTPTLSRSTGRGSESGRRLPDGTVIPDGTRVVTYVSRGLEMTRGFDVFLRAARRIAERVPDVLFVVAGTDKPHYGADRRVTGGATLRERLLGAGGYDPARFRFTGWLPADELARVLSPSDLHVYLTAPFVTSWSLLNAMSCGCVVLASDQACVREYVTDGRNGLLCDFFDDEALARRAVDVLADPQAHRPLGEAARRTIEDHYSLDAALPRVRDFFERVSAKPREPSARAELLVRRGTGLGVTVESPHADVPAVAELPPFEGTLPYLPDGARGEPHLLHGGNDEAPAAAAAKTVLFAWELGGGLGHLMQMLPLVEDLRAAGHCVVVALRDLSKAVGVFGSSGVFYLQAPHRPPRPGRFPAAASFAPLLASLGFGGDDELFGLACAWRNLIRSVSPDLIVCDCAPTALLASRAFPVRRVFIGSGFCCPPGRGAGEGGEDEAPPGACCGRPRRRRKRRASATALATLRVAKCPTLAVVDGATAAQCRRYGSATLKVMNRAADVARASRECDLALTHGGHGVVAEMLLAGKPLLNIPLVLEQQKTAEAVCRLGAGVRVAGNDLFGIAPAVRAMLGERYDACAAAARRFAGRYAAFDRARQRAAVFGRVARLLAAAPAEPVVAAD